MSTLRLKTVNVSPVSFIVVPLSVAHCFVFAVDVKAIKTSFDVHHLMDWKLPAELVGREWFMDKVDNWLSNPAGKHILLITGDPGIGKSAIAVALMKRKLPNAVVVGYH